ncbi:MAG: NADH-quinone oxidoreductase subunit NuoE [candidate division KSB1 bacterium]|nr:NADH-quinone oxidoreductase subunit NuoE [candidate division KSB1 bacterium]
MSKELTAKDQKVIKVITPEQFAQIDEIIARYRHKPGSLIPVLQQAQEVCGYLPQEVQRRIAKGLNIPPSQVYGVVTFYSLFHLEPKGRHIIRVCMGTACYVRGGKNILSKLKETLGVGIGGTTEDGRFTLDVVSCPGSCGLAPVMVIDDEIFGLLNPVKAAEILKEFK